MMKYGFAKLINRIKNNLAKLTGMCGVTPKQHALSEIENQCYKSSLMCKSGGKWVSLRELIVLEVEEKMEAQSDYL